MSGPIVERAAIEAELFEQLAEGSTSDQAVDLVAARFCLPREAVELVIEDLESIT